MNLAFAISDLLLHEARCGKTHVIAIDGRAGAGKTTLAQELYLALSLDNSVTVIHLDEIYEGWNLALSDSLTQKLGGLLTSLASGESFTLPIFDWSLGTFASNKVVEPCDILIIEGVGSAQKVVRLFSTATIWLDISPVEGLTRVLNRDGGSIEPEMIEWQKQEELHFIADQTRENSDFILSTS